MGHLLLMAMPSVVLASASIESFDPGPAAPFSVECDRNESGIGGYLVRVQSRSNASIKIYEVLINNRPECSTVQVIEGGELAGNQIQSTEDWGSPSVMHAIWLRSGKAIIDRNTTYNADVDLVLESGKRFLWQTACAPIDVKMTTSAGYAEFQFHTVLPPNPSVYFEANARKIPKRVALKGNLGW
ncbi:hypothetical protein [Methylovirgula ligni]|nr:hypothetical protein [Methylovirgula ligni]